MAINVDILQGHLTQAEFDAIPTFILGDGQIVWLKDNSGKFKKGDGVTILSALPFLGGGSQTLAQTLANSDIMPEGASIKSTDGLTQVIVNNGTFEQTVTDGVDVINSVNANLTKAGLGAEDGTDASSVSSYANRNEIISSVQNIFDAPNNKFSQEAPSKIAVFDANGNLKSGALFDIDLDTFSLNAKSLHVKGTGGAGHLGLKHQSSNITASASESTLGADINGNPVWKNDGNAIDALELQSNKQNSLANDGTGTKYPTVDATKAGLYTKLTPYIHVSTANFNPADNTYVFFGLETLGHSITTSFSPPNIRSKGVNKTGIIRSCIISMYIVNVSSGELSDFRIRNHTTSTTSVLGTTAFNVGANNIKTILFTGLNIPVTLGDECSTVYLTPTWATNPTGVYMVVTYMIE